jgi:nucleolar protein 56
MQVVREKLIKETKLKLEQDYGKDKLIVYLSRLVEEIRQMEQTLSERVEVVESMFKDVDEVIRDNKKLLKEMGKVNRSNVEHLGSLMRDVCPELVKVAGAELGAKLVASAGSLKKLAMMASSKIQVLGAEKALFRHLKTGAKAPKYGLIVMHESVEHAENKGKAARKLAASISKAVKVDYFKNGI